MGYNTVIAMGGRNLSGGQRQLIALTAAPASVRSLLLLDEAMSNMDAEAARAVERHQLDGPWTLVTACNG